MSRITSINAIKARRFAEELSESLSAKIGQIKTHTRKLMVGQESPNGYRRLPNKVAKRVDKEIESERLATLRQQPIDPVARKYRVLAALPYFDQIEAYVRWLGRKYGVDDAELWADVMDNICEADDDRIADIPEDKQHVINLFMATARTMVTTGKYRRNRVRSKANLPISGLERQEKSPAYNPWISAKGQSLPSVSADRVHYIGHKAPGLPVQNAFRKSGRIDEYLRAKGLDNLSEILHNSVVWTRSNGKGRDGHFTISWRKVAEEYGCKTDHERKKLKLMVLELLGTKNPITGVWSEDIPDEYGRHNEDDSLPITPRYIVPHHDYRGQPVTEIGRKVGDSSWRTNNMKRRDWVEHYQENPGHNCHVCRAIEADIVGWMGTNEAILNDWKETKGDTTN